MPRYTRLCPRCEEGTISYTTWREYQGEHPHGGMVEFVDEVVADCKCYSGDELGDMDLSTGFELEDECRD